MHLRYGCPASAVETPRCRAAAVGLPGGATSPLGMRFSACCAHSNATNMTKHEKLPYHVYINVCQILSHSFWSWERLEYYGIFLLIHKYDQVWTKRPNKNPGAPQFGHMDHMITWVCFKIDSPTSQDLQVDHHFPIATGDNLGITCLIRSSHERCRAHLDWGLQWSNPPR